MQLLPPTFRLRVSRRDDISVGRLAKATFHSLMAFAFRGPTAQADALRAPRHGDSQLAR